MPTRTIEVSPLVDLLIEKVDETSISEASRRLGVSRQAIMYWRAGMTEPKMNGDLQRRLATFLGVQPREVLRLAGFDLGGYLDSGAATHGYFLGHSVSSVDRHKRLHEARLASVAAC